MRWYNLIEYLHKILCTGGWQCAEVSITTKGIPDEENLYPQMFKSNGLWQNLPWRKRRNWMPLMRNYNYNCCNQRERLKGKTENDAWILSPHHIYTRESILHWACALGPGSEKGTKQGKNKKKRSRNSSSNRRRIHLANATTVSRGKNKKIK